MAFVHNVVGKTGVHSQGTLLQTTGFNRPGFPLIDSHVYSIVSDGDLMEGVAAEAASLAGHLKLGNLIYLYDDNQVTIEGFTSLAFTEDVQAPPQDGKDVADLAPLGEYHLFEGMGHCSIYGHTHDVLNPFIEGLIRRYV